MATVPPKNSSWVTNLGEFMGTAGCVWLKMKAIFGVLFFVPFAILILYFVSTIKTEDAYKVIGTVQTVSYNAANVTYTDPKTNLPVTKSVDITNLSTNSNVNSSSKSTSSAVLVKGSPITLYIDKKNSSNVSVQQPFTKTMKGLIIGAVSFILGLIIFEVITAFYNKQVCKALGAGQLVFDAVN